MKLPDHARKVYQGGIFGVHEWEQEMFDGSFEIFERVSALPIVKLICVLDDGTILINQEEQPGKDSFLSLPGGRLELEETLEEGARRELLEETGYSADTLELIDTHHVGYRLDLDIHLYLARWLTRVTFPSLDPEERIKTQSISLDKFLELSLTQVLHPKSLQYFLLREYYADSTLTAFKQKILGNF